MLCKKCKKGIAGLALLPLVRFERKKRLTQSDIAAEGRHIPKSNHN